MSKCPRDNCNGDTFLKFDLGEWYLECLLCSRRFHIEVNGLRPSRYSEIPTHTESPFTVRSRPVKSYNGLREE
jgi:hypothetical protein